jgi:energy-coupling factor transporter ATP-binding protein EcfA2
MAGNVSEWCADWYDQNYYVMSLQKDPLGPVEGTYRVVRGGCWGSEQDLHCTARKGAEPDFKHYFIGFRCARDIEAPPVENPTPPAMKNTGALPSETIHVKDESEMVLVPAGAFQMGSEEYDFDERPKRAMELLERVGLAEFADKLPMSVSTGQQQSAAIARAMATDPPLIVADEPTGNLDTRAAGNVIDLFEDLVSSGKTIVMVTHDPSLTLRTHRNVIISDGELIDEVVARALPLLTHPQMLGITKQVTRKMYQPGQPILLRNEEVRSFFMIATGEVEVVLEREKGPGQVIARLKSGDFFGETSLLSGGRAVASVHAAGDTPAVLLELPREEFLKMIQESPLTEEAIGKIVQKRLTETGAVVPDKADKAAKKKKK